MRKARLLLLSLILGLGVIFFLAQTAAGAEVSDNNGNTFAVTSPSSGQVNPGSFAFEARLSRPFACAYRGSAITVRFFLQTSTASPHGEVTRTVGDYVSDAFCSTAGTSSSDRVIIPFSVAFDPAVHSNGAYTLYTTYTYALGTSQGPAVPFSISNVPVFSWQPPTPADNATFTAPQHLTFAFSFSYIANWDLSRMSFALEQLSRLNANSQSSTGGVKSFECSGETTKTCTVTLSFGEGEMGSWRARVSGYRKDTNQVVEISRLFSLYPMTCRADIKDPSGGSYTTKIPVRAALSSSPGGYAAASITLTLVGQNSGKIYTATFNVDKSSNEATGTLDSSGYTADTYAVKADCAASYSFSDGLKNGRSLQTDSKTIAVTKTTKSGTPGEGGSNGNTGTGSSDSGTGSTPPVIGETTRPKDVERLGVRPELTVEKTVNSETALPSGKYEVVLSGKAPARALVTVLIFSTPVEVTTRANENGDWTVTTQLEGGNHTAYVTLKDEDGVEKRSQAVDFVVAARAEAASSGSGELKRVSTETPQAQRRSREELFLLGTLGVIAAAVFGFYLVKRFIFRRPTPIHPQTF